MEKTTNLGMGVMLGMLSGATGKTAVAIQYCLGKTINKLDLKEDILKFEFTDGTKLDVWDNGQSCCEHRYMTTDDGLQYYTGSFLMGMEVVDGGSKDEDYEVHEIQFLNVKTSKGVFQMCSHNEHNGYYAGILIEAKLEG